MWVGGVDRDPGAGHAQALLVQLGPCFVAHAAASGCACLDRRFVAPGQDLDQDQVKRARCDGVRAPRVVRCPVMEGSARALVSESCFFDMMPTFPTRELRTKPGAIHRASLRFGLAT